MARGEGNYSVAACEGLCCVGPGSDRWPVHYSWPAAHTSHCHQHPRPPDCSVSPLSATCSGTKCILFAKFIGWAICLTSVCEFKLKIPAPESFWAPGNNRLAATDDAQRCTSRRGGPDADRREAALLMTPVVVPPLPSSSCWRAGLQFLCPVHYFCGHPVIT